MSVGMNNCEFVDTTNLCSKIFIYLTCTCSSSLSICLDNKTIPLSTVFDTGIMSFLFQVLVEVWT